MSATSATEWVGRVAVVTGGASGIGAATARRLHAAGARVVLTDVQDTVHAVAAELGEQAYAARADVGDPDDWARVARLCDDLGGVHVLVLNAARQIPARLLELSAADWDAQLSANLRGAYLGLHALLPALRQSAGRVVIVSSVHARFGLPRHPAYAASKAGLVALAQQVAVDYAPVRVNCVLPGPVRTPAWDGIEEAARERSVAQTALKRFGQPDEVAAVIEFLASDAAGFVTGASLVVDGGWSVTKDSA